MQSNKQRSSRFKVIWQIKKYFYRIRKYFDKINKYLEDP